MNTEELDIDTLKFAIDLCNVEGDDNLLDDAEARGAWACAERLKELLVIVESQKL